MSGVYVPRAVLEALGRSTMSPNWLRVWAWVAARADEDGTANFDALELRSLMRSGGPALPNVDGVTNAITRARSLGLIGERVGLVEIQLGPSMRPA